MGRIRNTSRVVQGLAALTAVLAAVVSCGGDDGSAADDSTTTTEQTTTTTVPSYDVERARAAVDAVTDLPEGYTITQSCLTPADVEREEICRNDEVDGVSEVMFGATNEAQSAIAVSALVFPDPDSAAARFAEWTADDDVYDGAFDVPAEDLGGGNSSPGRRGEGTIDETEVGGWSGFRGLLVYDMVDGDGEVINHVTEAEVTLTRGNVLIQVLIDDVEDGATREAVGADADDRARRLVDAFG